MSLPWIVSQLKEPGFTKSQETVLRAKDSAEALSKIFYLCQEHIYM